MAQNVSTRKLKAIEALVQSATITKSAERAGVSRRTLTRWLHEDLQFQEALQQARAELLRHGTSRICGLLGPAITVIATSLKDGNIDWGRLLSARFIVEKAIAIQEKDLDLRVCQLEERVRQGRFERQQEYDRMSDEQIKGRMRELQSKMLPLLDENQLQDYSNDIREALRQRVAAGLDGNGEEDNE